MQVNFTFYLHLTDNSHFASSFALVGVCTPEPHDWKKMSIPGKQLMYTTGLPKNAYCGNLHISCKKFLIRNCDEHNNNTERVCVWQRGVVSLMEE